MFSEFRTAQLEVAPLRARLVWADALDDLLDDRDLRAGEPALRHIQDILRDPDVVVARADLQRVRALLRDTVGEGPDDADAVARRAVALAAEFGTGGVNGAERRWSAA
jgi:hypothetical protein